MIQRQNIKVVYFGDHYWSDVHHGGNFNPFPGDSHSDSKWDSIAVIEEMQEYDTRLNDGKDPHLLKTERYWGPSYFFDDVLAYNWSGHRDPALRRNFFVSEVEKTARYALPFVRNMSHFIK